VVPLPHPLGSLRLFGLEERSRDVVLSAGLVGLVVVSRLVAFPASIWEQDEAIFAGAVVRFDPTDNLPHPPWFPLWIAVGRLVHALGVAPESSLQLTSAVVSVWILFPLTALWAAVLPRRLAVWAAVVFLVLPGPWLLSGRAFCGTTATALLVTALAFWCRAEHRSSWLCAGAIAAAGAVLVRPHFVPAVLGAMLFIGMRNRGDRLKMTVAIVIPVVAGVAVLIWLSGGVEPLVSALRAHAEYHFTRLDQAERGFVGSGFAKALGHPAGALIWTGLFLAGLGRLVRSGTWASVSPVVLGALVPLLVVIHGLSNPAHARYAIPMLALTSGPVVLGTQAVFRRWAEPVMAVGVCAAALLIVPQLVAYRSMTSPPIAAISEALDQAGRLDAVVVADRRLHAFFVLRRLVRPTPVPILFDHMIELGHVRPPPPARTVYVFDHVGENLMVSAARQETFDCSVPLVRTLAQGRFLDLHVAIGASLGSKPGWSAGEHHGSLRAGE